MIASISLRSSLGFLARSVGTSPEFEHLQSDPSAEVVYAFLMRPRDPETLTERMVLVTTGARLHTEVWEDPPNAIFRSVVLKGFSLTRHLSEPGRLLASSSVSGSTASFDNSRGDITWWLDLDWSEAELEIRAGGRLGFDGLAYPFSLFRTVHRLIVEEATAGADGSIDLRIVGRRRMLEDNMVTELYGGFGGAVSLPAGERLTGTLPSSPTTKLTIDWIGTVETFPIDQTALLVVDGSSPYGLFLGPGGSFFVYSLIGYSPLSYALPSSALGKRIRAVLSLESGYGAALRVAIEGEETDQVGFIPGFGGLLTNSGGSALVGTVGGESGSAITVFELRLFNFFLTDDDVSVIGDGPLLDPPNTPDLTECWKFEEGVDATAYGELGVCDLTLSAGASWSSSYEGDDPETFPGGPIGQTKPDGFGRCRNVGLLAVDSQKGLFQWSRTASGDIERLKVAGAPMVPSETLTSTGAGQVYFDGPTKEIRLSGGLNGHRFVPGQASPVRVGQRIEVLGTVSNNGTKTVAVNGVREGGATIIVVESVTTESAPSGTIVRSLAADVQYTYDLSTSTIAVPDASLLEGDLTADVILRTFFGGKARLSDIAREVLSDAVDVRALLWDPEVGFWMAPGAKITHKAFLDEIVASGLAWWVEAKTGGYRLGTFRLPAGAPKTRITGSRIASIEGLPTVPPFYRIFCDYDRTWKTLNQGTMAGSVPPAERDRLAREFQAAPRTAPKSLRNKFPLSKERPSFKTYLTNRSDAETFLTLASPLYQQKLRWCRLVVDGLGPEELDLDDCVWIEHPDPNLKLTAGALARVIGIGDDYADQPVPLEVFLP